MTCFIDSRNMAAKKPSGLHKAVHDKDIVTERRQKEALYIGVKISLEERPILHFHNLQRARLISATEQFQLLTDAASLREKGRQVRRWKDTVTRCLRFSNFHLPLTDLKLQVDNIRGKQFESQHSISSSLPQSHPWEHQLRV